MGKRIEWSIELKTVVNTSTNKTHYYMFGCGVWNRVSENAYLSREDDSIRQDNFLTQIRGDLVYNFKTVYGVHYCKS